MTRIKINKENIIFNHYFLLQVRVVKLLSGIDKKHHFIRIIEHTKSTMDEKYVNY